MSEKNYSIQSLLSCCWLVEYGTVYGTKKLRYNNVWRWRMAGRHLSLWVSKGGRNNTGRRTSYKGGCAGRFLKVDFSYSWNGVCTKLLCGYRDRVRSGILGFFFSQSGTFSWRLMSTHMKYGSWYSHLRVSYFNKATSDKLKYSWIGSFAQSEMKWRNGSSSFLYHLPVGTLVSNLELYPGCGGQLLRSAGTGGTVLQKKSKYGFYIPVLLASGEVRLFNGHCIATLGMIFSTLHKWQNLGTAGRHRKLGYHPRVRGVAMNPVDHPHGGGEGRKSKWSSPYNRYGYHDKYKKTSRRLKKNPHLCQYHKDSSVI